MDARLGAQPIRIAAAAFDLIAGERFAIREADQQGQAAVADRVHAAPLDAKAPAG